MKDLIGKDLSSKWHSFKTLVSQHPSVFILVGVLIFLSIIIQIFSASQCPQELSFINCIARQIVGYFKDWGLLIGAVATILLAWAAFWNISDARFFRAEMVRQRRVDKLATWAKEALTASRGPLRTTGEKPEDYFKKWLDKFTTVKIECLSIQGDAVLIGKDIQDKAEIAVGELIKYTDAIKQNKFPSTKQISDFIKCMGDVIRACSKK